MDKVQQLQITMQAAANYLRHIQGHAFEIQTQTTHFSDIFQRNKVPRVAQQSKLRQALALAHKSLICSH